MDKFQAQLMAFDAYFFSENRKDGEIESMETQQVDYNPKFEMWKVRYKIFFKNSEELECEEITENDMEYDLEWLNDGIKLVLI